MIHALFARLSRFAHRPRAKAYSVTELLSQRALFVITPGRSGTKSFIDLCRRHTTMHCEHAPRPTIASIGFMFHQGRITPEAARYAFYATREPHLAEAFARGSVYCDGDCKTLPVTLELADMLPAASFIHLVRHPLRFILSGLDRGYYSTMSPELWGHLLPGSGSGLTRIEKIAWFWNEANCIAEEAKRILGTGRVVTLVAERMFASPAVVMEALESLGLEDVAREHRTFTIGRLNKGRRANPPAPELSAEIEQAIQRHCPTVAKYYD